MKDQTVSGGKGHTINATVDLATAKALREQGERLGLNLTTYARLLLTTSVGSAIERRDAPAEARKKATRERQSS